MDLVLFLSCFPSFQDQAEHRASVISFIEKRLTQYGRSLAYSITMVPQRETTRVPRSLSFHVKARKNSEAIGVDVLPAYDALSKENNGAGPEKLGRGPPPTWPWGRFGKVEARVGRVEFAFFSLKGWDWSYTLKINSFHKLMCFHVPLPGS